MSLFVERRSDPPMSAIPSNSELIASYAAEPVTTDTAMRLDAVWACVNLLTNITGTTIGWGAYNDKAEGRQRVADPQMLRNPDPSDPSITGMGWRRQVLMSWFLRGNAWGTVLAHDSAMRPTAIKLLHPDLVSYSQMGYMGDWKFRVMGVEKERWPNGPLWHKPSLFQVPGIPVGLSPIEYAMQSIGLGLAAEKFGAQWFGDGAHPSSVLMSEKPITEKQARTIKARFLKSTRRRREPAVLGLGLKYQQIQVAANESQFLDTIKANVATICRYYGIHPSTLGGDSGGSSLTYANREQNALELLTLSAHPWVVLLEEMYNEMTPRPTLIMADTDALLRLDAKTKAEVDSLNVRTGVRSRDECRGKDGLGPIPGGDGGEFLWPPMAVKIESVAVDSGGTPTSTPGGAPSGN